MTRTSLILITALTLAAACTPPPPPVASPRAENRQLPDPRIGYERGSVTPQTTEAFDAAWRSFLSGDYEDAGRRVAEIRKRDPHYEPAVVLAAAIALRQDRLQDARTLIDTVRPYNGATFYAAEIAYEQHDLRRALALYRDLAGQPGASPRVSARMSELEKGLFEQLYQEALGASDRDAINLLREALQMQPGAANARILLAQKLAAAKDYDEARRELEPVLPTGDVDRADVQQTLAEIDAGRGRYQEAIVRYERLARREHSTSYARRIDELKEAFTAANMPAQYQRALESASLTRAGFAVLLYWKVASVRFAQNVGAPPIATDVTELPGREELIRAIALGILPVDPVTRRVGPGSTINGSTLTRLLTRVLTSRGASCAHLPGTADAAAVLRACAVSEIPATTPDIPVTGRIASAALAEVDRALK